MVCHLRYGNFKWGLIPEIKLCSLQKIHNRAFYLIESAPMKDQIPSARPNVDKIISPGHNGKQIS